MLVAYAGRDPEEPAIDASEPRCLHRKSNTRPEMAYRLFLLGNDTFYLAQRFKYSEQTVLRWITAERCKRRGLASPYARQS